MLTALYAWDTVNIKKCPPVQRCEQQMGEPLHHFTSCSGSVKNSQNSVCARITSDKFGSHKAVIDGLWAEQWQKLLSISAHKQSIGHVWVSGFPVCLVVNSELGNLQTRASTWSYTSTWLMDSYSCVCLCLFECVHVRVCVQATFWRGDSSYGSATRLQTKLTFLARRRSLFKKSLSNVKTSFAVQEVWKQLLVKNSCVQVWALCFSLKN